MKTYVNQLQKKMFLMAFITAVFTELSQIIALTVDSIVVCVFMGEREIAAVGITGPFFFLVGIPASCLAVGIQTICSHEMGKGYIDKVSRKISEVLLFAAAVLGILTVVIMLQVPQMAFLFGARGNAADLQGPVSQYLYGLGIELFPFVAMSVLTPVIILDNGSRLVMISSIAGCVTNVVIDFLVAVKHWGLFGIGLGSSLSVIVSLCILLTHFADKKALIRLKPVRVSSEDIVEIIRLGLPQAAHSVANMIRVWVLNILIIVLGGNAAMSVMTINGTIMDFVDVFAIGIAGAVGVLAGIGYGEENGEEMEGAVYLGHQYVLIASTLIMGLLTVLTRVIAAVFITPDSGTFPLLLFAIRCLIVGLLPNALLYSRVSYLQAIGKTEDAQLMEMAVNMVLLTACAFILSVPFGAHGVFAAYPVSKILAVVITYYRHTEGLKKLRLSEHDFMDLDESFYPPVRNIIAYPVNTLEECALASEQVHLFCKGHHFDKRTAFFSAVCIEEILTNIIQHGNEERSKKVDPVAEIRVTLSGEELIMRIRDNGMAFNLNTIARMLNDETDPFAAIGLKIISAAAKEIKYYRLYGMNTTIIRIGSGDDAAEGGEGSHEGSRRRS